MDISNVASVAASASAASQAQVGDAVLKKALDVQAQGALRLIQAIPQVASGTTTTLGKNVNATA